MFRKTLAAAILLGSAFAITNASAAPLAPQASGLENGVTFVRNGCGPGRHFSFRLGRCVLNYGGPVYYGGYGYRHYGWHGGGRRWHGGGGHWHGGGGHHHGGHHRR